MKTNAVLLLSVCLAALPGALLAQSGFQNGTFDSPGTPPGFSMWALWTNGSDYITGWVTTPGYNGSTSGVVEYIRGGTPNPDGCFVELGLYDSVAGLQQQFSTAPNHPYLVSFWLATDPLNGPPAVLRVSAAGTSADYQAPPGTGEQFNWGWQKFSFHFTSDNTGLTTLWFGNVVGVPAIDTVVVPEPGACTLFGLGVLALFWHWGSKASARA